MWIDSTGNCNASFIEGSRVGCAWDYVTGGVSEKASDVVDYSIEQSAKNDNVAVSSSPTPLINPWDVLGFSAQVVQSHPDLLVIPAAFKAVSATNNLVKGVGTSSKVAGEIESIKALGVNDKKAGELNAKITLKDIEGETGAHFVSKHGPQTPLSQQYRRATTGQEPDGMAGFHVGKEEWS